MSIRYYPTSRIKTGLKTAGNQYLLNGKPYKGDYYLTYKGEAYTGKNPTTGPNELLTIIGSDNPLGTAARQTTRAAAVRGGNSGIGVVYDKEKRQTSLQQLVPYYPFPLENDYTRGYFTRYFAKKVNTSGYIIEISYDQYVDTIEENDPAFEDYEAVDMFWQLKGPLNDQRLSQYEIKGGVYDTNKRITENTAKGFNGLIEFIGGDYTKYARIT